MKAGWRKGALSEFFETVTGNTPSKQNAAFYGDGVPLIKPPELTGGMLYEASDNLTQLGAESARVLPINSVLVSCIGNLGKIGMNAVPVAFNQQINAILPRPELFDPRFTFYFTHSEMFSEQLEAGASGTTVAIVNKSRFNTIEIPLPPLDEQKRIVAVLDAAFEGLSRARAHAQTNLENARELLGTTVDALLVGSDLPWKVGRLGSIVHRLTNGFVGPTRDIYHETGVPYLLARHVKNNELNFDGRTHVSDAFNEKNKKSKLKVGDVLLVQSGHIGHSAVVPPEHEGHNCHAMIVISPFEDVLTGDYLSIFFNSASMQRGFEAIRSGSTVPHLTCKEVREIMVPLPSLAEQAAIVETVKNMTNVAKQLQSHYRAKLADLDALRQALLQKAFAGELT